MVAEEFGCTLSQAQYELDHLPHGLIWEVIEQRAYARTYRAVMDAKRREDVPKTPLVELVMDVEAVVFKIRRGL